MEPEFSLIEKNNIEIILPLLEELDPTIVKMNLLVFVESGRWNHLQNQ